MVEMRGLTLQQLQDLYDASTPEVRNWMLKNVQLGGMRTENLNKYSVNLNLYYFLDYCSLFRVDLKYV